MVAPGARADTLRRVKGRPVDLVLEGGGVKGIGLVGALGVLEREGYWPLNLAGASAGAIVATLYGVGYSAADLRDIVHGLDFSRFQDAGWRRHVTAIGGAVGILRRQGFNRGQVFLDWMRARLEAKGVRTFGDLAPHDARGADERPFTHHLQVIVSDLTQRRLLVLPRDAAELGIEPGDLEVALAVRASMSVPFVFEPVRIENKRTGVTHVLVDGGVLSNFPVWLFDSGGVPKRPTIGLLLVEPEPRKPLGAPPAPVPAPTAGVRALVNHGKSLIQTMLEAHDRLYLEAADYARTIPIPTLGIGAVDFGLSREQMDALIQSGADAAERFLATWDFQGYIEGFRRGGGVPSRREEMAARMGITETQH